MKEISIKPHSRQTQEFLAVYLGKHYNYYWERSTGTFRMLAHPTDAASIAKGINKVCQSGGMKPDVEILTPVATPTKVAVGGRGDHAN